MPEQIVEKQRNLIQNIQRLADMEDPEFADFWQLLGYHDAITPEIQRVALAAEVFWPCEIYYHAPADVRDGLIHALLSAEYFSAASNLMSCLAMQGDDKAMETLLELERNPRPWRKGLYVDPSSYAQIGGWTFDKEGQKIQLNFDTCYPTDYDELLAMLENRGFSLPTADEWAYLCGGGCRTLFPWGDGLDYSMRLRWFEDMDEDENRPYDMEEPNFFGLSIAYDPYMREVVQADRLTTCGGDGGCNICGGLGPFLGFLPCSPHCKPEVQEDNELNGDYDFYRPIIRLENYD